MQEYQMAKSTYEAGFMAFLGNKFSQEYVASPDGKIAADNLLATIRKSKEHIHAQLKAKEDKYVTNIFGKPVKFNDEDITQLLNLFKQFKQNK